MRIIGNLKSLNHIFSLRKSNVKCYIVPKLANLNHRPLLLNSLLFSKLNQIEMRVTINESSSSADPSIVLKICTQTNSWIRNLTSYFSEVNVCLAINPEAVRFIIICLKRVCNQHKHLSNSGLSKIINFTRKTSYSRRCRREVWEAWLVLGSFYPKSRLLLLCFL